MKHQITNNKIALNSSLLSNNLPNCLVNLENSKVDNIELFSYDTCTADGCLSDTAYALVNPITKKVHRISFSASLLNYIRTNYSEWKHLELKTIKFRLGKDLKPDEESSTGCYAIVKSKTNWTLRISLIKNVANYLCDFDSRKIRECLIEKIY